MPAGHCVQALLGFVHELVVNDDPEYQWIDKIRTPRASNEARQTLFSKLSGEVQRRVGVTVIEAGGNAVIGYCAGRRPGWSGPAAGKLRTGHLDIVRPASFFLFCGWGRGYKVLVH